MMLRKKTKENPAKSCLITLVTLVGLLAACFVFCTVVFQLNQASTGATGFLLPFGG
jgi:hypothetical protein